VEIDRSPFGIEGAESSSSSPALSGMREALVEPPVPQTTPENFFAGPVEDSDFDVSPEVVAAGKALARAAQSRASKAATAIKDVQEPSASGVRRAGQPAAAPPAGDVAASLGTSGRRTALPAPPAATPPPSLDESGRHSNAGR